MSVRTSTRFVQTKWYFSTVWNRAAMVINITDVNEKEIIYPF